MYRFCETEQEFSFTVGTRWQNIFMGLQRETGKVRIKYQVEKYISTK